MATIHYMNGDTVEYEQVEISRQTGWAHAFEGDRQISIPPHRIKHVEEIHGQL